MRETEVVIQSAVTLSGSLTLPDRVQEKCPAILLIPGTGKLNRDGKVNKKLDLKVYKQLAQFFTELGFISLRYDKRGVGKSEGDYNRTGLWDLVDDSQAAVQFLKMQDGVDIEKVIVLGHSEGCTIGTALAAREPIAGLILLAGAVERLEEALKRQREIAAIDMRSAKGFIGFLLRLFRTDKKIEPQAQAFMKKVIASKEDIMKVQFQTINAKWMREHFSYNVREDLTKVTCPVLAITGSRDVQANPAVLEDLASFVKGESEFHIVENMGHSLKFQAQTSHMLTIKKDLIAESSLPLHPELETLLRNWVDKQFLDVKMHKKS
ncbi:alpha/beta hydrolase [Robertmurraya korlensis]|uniref:alpha/beta hydrolase n=1 Tax=Robertmurraya korlensis TaxID=519977 RepID=UPI000826ADD3|nr:alpha/beta hydrolase [Robertmurraya korlensis]